MQRGFFRQPVFAYISGGAICLFALILAWQHPSFLNFSLVVLINIIVVLMVTTLLRGLAIQENLEAQDDRLQLDAELPHRLSDLLQNILPLSNSHVKTVKTHSEHSVHQLIMSFSSIVYEFDKAGFGRASNVELNTSKNSDVMRIALSAADRSAIQDKRVLEVFGAVVRDVLSHVETMGNAAQQMRRHGNVIRCDIEDLLVTLPFQDRISQILRVVKNDIAKLEKTTSKFNNGNFPKTATWLDELKNTFTMHDEHRSHNSGGAAAINNTQKSLSADSLLVQINEY